MKPYVGLIIQSRLGSTRFPKKTLAQINGHSVLEHVVDRCHLAESVDKIVIACPESPECCLNEEIFIGSEYDVLNRYYDCAKKFKFDVIVRVTADCPLIPPFEIDRVVNFLIENDYDYVSNQGTVTDGFDVEAFTFKTLEKTWKDAETDYEREHVTPYMKHSMLFKTKLLEFPKLSVDTPEDLERVKQWIGIKVESL